MNDLQVAGTQIRRDEAGRYCLNDLHRAAGGQEKQRPSRWLRHEPAKHLIRAIDEKTSEAFKGFRKENNKPKFELIIEREFPLRSVVARSTGRPETFVVKQLVYAYAMWISPEFHLAVIDAYDALVSGEFIQPHIQHENYWFERRPHWPPIRFRVLAGECYRDIAAALQISRGSVARAVRSMIRVGLLTPGKVAQLQKGPAKKAALRYANGWGLRQLSLFEEVQLA